MARFVSKKPSTPGEILNLDFLEPMGITQQALATHIGVDVKTINRLIQGHTSLTKEMARKLAGSFQTTPEFWINLQTACDLHEIRNSQEAPIPPIAKTA